MIEAPTEAGLSFNAFTLGPKSYHPWLLAARLVERDDASKVRDLLATYYTLVQPRSLCDWLDVPADACPGLAELPVYGWAAVLPWGPADPRKKIRRIEDTQLQENKRLGLNEGISAGAKAFGPVSDDKLRVETERISRLAVSIRRSGFEPPRADYNVRAVFLVANGRWSWLPVGGMHRIPVAAGLGITRVPVGVIAVVRRDDVDIWPQVTSGLYNKDVALTLFDRLFNGRAPRCARSWIDWVDAERSDGRL
jgi:hypothetical protein